MRYNVLITKRARKQLLGLPATTRERIAEAIGVLGNNPHDPALSVKALTNDQEAEYRLRVGNYRVKYNRDDGIQIIEVVRVGHRKEAYR